MTSRLVQDDHLLTARTARSGVGWNHWARRNFGYEKREVLGRKPFFLYGPAGGEMVPRGTTITIYVI